MHRSVCKGDLDDHCCHLGPYGVCQYLEENTVPGRRWACGLLRELKNWNKVHTDSRYVDNVKTKLIELNVLQDCGDWPAPGVRCATCNGVG